MSERIVGFLNLIEGKKCSVATDADSFNMPTPTPFSHSGDCGNLRFDSPKCFCKFAEVAKPGGFSTLLPNTHIPGGGYKFVMKSGEFVAGC